MRKMNIPSLSGNIPIEIKRAFQEMRDHFNHINNEGGTATAATIASDYYTKRQANALFELKNAPVKAQTGEVIGAYVTYEADGNYYIEWRVIG